MRTESHRPSAEDLWERRLADRMLARLDIIENVAVESETSHDERLRQTLAQRFRNVIGVAPSQRGMLRTLLSSLSEIDTVEEIIEHVRRATQENGVSSPFV